MELFIDFFDNIGLGILLAMEESISTGKIYEGINSTYISLIPKVNNPGYSSEFDPISSCNLIYNVISKIISKRI